MSFGSRSSDTSSCVPKVSRAALSACIHCSACAAVILSDSTVASTVSSASRRLVDQIVLHQLLVGPLAVGVIEVRGWEQSTQCRIIEVGGERFAQLGTHAADDIAHDEVELDVDRPVTTDSEEQRSSILLHGRPQAMLVEAEDVELGLLAGSVGDDGAALVVHVEHQPLGLLVRVAEQLLEHDRSRSP